MFERIHSEADQVRLHLRGELDASGSERLREGLITLAAADCRELVIDFSHVYFIDGSGLGAIAFLYKRLAARGRRLSVTGANGQPLAMMRHLGLTALLGVPDAPARAARAGQGGFAWMRGAVAGRL